MHIRMKRQPVDVVEHARFHQAICKPQVHALTGHCARQNHHRSLVGADASGRLLDEQAVVPGKTGVDRVFLVPLVPDFVEVHAVGELARDEAGVVAVGVAHCRLSRLGVVLVKRVAVAENQQGSQAMFLRLAQI